MVNPFTINGEELKLMKFFNVDSVIPDCPDVCKRIFKN